MPNKFYKTTLILVVLAALSGCAVGPNFIRPQAPDTDRYAPEVLPESTVAAAGHAQYFIQGSNLRADWWRLFNSKDINTIVDQSLANNPTLQSSEANLREAQDNMRAGYGVFFPQISAGAGIGRERDSEAQEGLTGPARIFNLATLSGTVSYALDVFGGARRSVESLKAQAEYQDYETKAAYIILSANAVNTSIAHAAYLAQIHTTQDLIKLEEEQLKLTQVQAKAGTVSYANVLTVQNTLADTNASLAPLTQQADQANHLLMVLEGALPSQAYLPNIDLNNLSLPTQLPVSLPSDLVKQRPDILAAEAQMHVASAKIGVATALMFPSFSLNGTFGTSGTNFENLTAASGKFWSIGPTATIPVFQGTTLWFGRKASIDAYVASLANYRQTVLSSFEQVANSLKALEHDAQILQAESQARQAAGDTLKLLQVNYRAGLNSYLDVLTANVQYHQTVLAYEQALAQRYQDTVALFVALGGGWWNAV